jgi:hypothetical protein
LAVLPIRRHVFFEQTVLQGQIGDHLLERRGLTPKIVDLAFQNDPDLLLGRIVLARRPSDVLNKALTADT